MHNTLYGNCSSIIWKNVKCIPQILSVWAEEWGKQKKKLININKWYDKKNEMGKKLGTEYNNLQNSVQNIFCLQLE